MQRDMFTEAGAGYAELVAARAARYGGRALTVEEAAAVLEISPTKAREYIEGGRLSAANLNVGLPLRPLYRLTAEGLKAFAERAEKGV